MTTVVTGRVGAESAGAQNVGFSMLGWPAADSLADFQRRFLRPDVSLEVVIDRQSAQRALLLKVTTPDAFAHYPLDPCPHPDLKFGSRGWGWSLAHELVSLNAAVAAGTAGAYIVSSTMNTGALGGEGVRKAIDALPRMHRRGDGV